MRCLRHRPPARRGINSDRQPARKRGAFTLVELLVVIGIIAVLVSILLPALSSARRQADSLKCATALREIGNAIQMYVGEFKGATVPARVWTGTASVTGAGFATGPYSPYELNGVSLGAAASANDARGNVIASTTGAYWFDFLTRYVSRGKKMGAASATAAQAGDAQRSSVVWGCPTFQKYITSVDVGGFRRVQTGYGFNSVPTFTSTYPSIGTDFPPNTFDTNGRAGAYAVVGSTNDWRSVTHGTWFKLKQYTSPSERVVIADAQYWLLETNGAPTATIPGQKTYNNVITFSLPGQTTADFYRHGSPPRIQLSGDNGYFSTKGGKISYNALYADGHVSQVPDRETIYKSIRQRFPG